jgi:hypothetical protein
LFTKTQFDVTRLEDGVRVATTDTLSNMLAEFISSVHILVQNNAPPIDLNEPVTYYVENNVGTVYKGLNESLYLRYMSHLTVTDAYEQRFHIVGLNSPAFLNKVLVKMFRFVFIPTAGPVHTTRRGC